MIKTTSIDAASSEDPFDAIAEWLAMRTSQRSTSTTEDRDRAGWLDALGRRPNDTATDHGKWLITFIQDCRRDETLAVVPILDAIQCDDIEAARREANAIMRKAEDDQSDLDALEALLLGWSIERVYRLYRVGPEEDLQ